MLRFHLITLFPEACDAYLNASILGRARAGKKISVDYQTPRDYVDNKWGKVDERPYGGGPGMVMTALPVVRAVKKSLSRRGGKKIALVWFSPSASAFTNKEADKLAKFDDVVLVCGRYEGIDDRALSILKTFGTVKKYAVGEATLTGAEVPAMAIVDAVTRRLPGVLGKDESVEERRTASPAVYTRPESITWEGKRYKAPAVLLTGNHADIDSWKKNKTNKKGVPSHTKKA
ncbi:MAG: tRNA (guanosine(37)-N1)-methyltransferase TrmD [Patescibacteria group bacterium]